MFVGGDFVIPLLKINDVKITDEPGVVTKMFQEFLASDKTGSELAEEIPDFDII